MSEFIVKRTFHPIGHGAFYSEEFEFDSGESKFVVYDCGSGKSNEPSSLLKKVVGNAFPDARYDIGGRAEIDVLFLSHFHNDHINGLSLLQPKRVVCPFYHDEEILMFRVLNEYFKEWDIDLMVNPKAFLGSDTIIITVKPMGEDGEDIQRNADVRNIDSIHKDKEISSGTPLGISGSHADINWCYIPYNFHNGEWLTKFKALLGSDYEVLTQNPDEYIKDNKSKLRKICKAFENDLNDLSLIVYSGPVKPSSPQLMSTTATPFLFDWRYRSNRRLLEKMIRYMDDFRFYEMYHRFYGMQQIRYEKPAAIFYGDITLNETLIKTICRNLSDKVGFIGTIQIPHHGSYRSFDKKISEYYDNGIWNKYPDFSILYIICAKKSDPCHPGKQTIAKLKACAQMYEIVSEANSSGVTEIWLMKE